VVAATKNNNAIIKGSFLKIVVSIFIHLNLYIEDKTNYKEKIAEDVKNELPRA